MGTVLSVRKMALASAAVLFRTGRATPEMSDRSAANVVANSYSVGGMSVSRVASTASAYAVSMIMAVRVVRA